MWGRERELLEYVHTSSGILHPTHDIVHTERESQRQREKEPGAVSQRRLINANHPTAGLNYAAGWCATQYATHRTIAHLDHSRPVIAHVQESVVVKTQKQKKEPRLQRSSWPWPPSAPPSSFWKLEQPLLLLPLPLLVLQARVALITSTPYLF